MPSCENRPAGRCSCGAIRYRLETAPLVVHCCHCSWCQRETGSAFAINALIEADRVTLVEGSPIGVSLPSASGKGQTLFRCPDCGVTLWSHYAGAGDRVNFVRVGTLEDGSGIVPDIHIYTASKQDWVVIPDDVPAFADYYSPKDCWPEDSIRRWRALPQT